MPEETVVLKNKISELSKLQGVVEGFGKGRGFSPAVIHDVNLVLEEAGVNVIRYAYPDNGPETEILLRMQTEGKELVLEIEDGGIAFNPVDFPEPDFKGPSVDRSRGGMGIYLIRQLSKSVSYKRNNNKNILTITVETGPDA